MLDSDALRQHFERLIDEELIAILRDRDEEQWRPEVFAIVASVLESRGISAREAVESEEAEESEFGDSESGVTPGLVMVARYFSPLDAQTDRMALEAGGIKAWVFKEVEGTAESIGPGAVLKVQANDFAAAMEILEPEPAPSSALPAEFAEPQCPRCGSMEVREDDEVCELLDPSAGSLSTSERRVYLYRCASCGHSWSG